MISIAACAFAVDGLATDIRELGSTPAVLTPRSIAVWETIRVNFDVSSKTQVWPPALKELWKLRGSRPGGGLAHPKTVAGEPVQLPEVSNAPARLTYTAETAT